MRVVVLLALLPVFLLAQEPTIAELVQQLADDDFDTREKATKLLEARGEAARAAVAKAAKESPDADVRQRAADLLAAYDRQADDRSLAERIEALKRLDVPAFDATALRPIVEKKGRVTGREVWTANRTYHVTADLDVLQAGSVTIEPGTVVLVAAGANLRFHGDTGAELVAVGTAEKPIVVTSAAEKDGRPGHWGQLVALDANLLLKHVQFRRSGGVVLQAGPGAYEVEHLAVYDTRGDALRLVERAGKIQGLTVRQATGTGLVVEGCAPNVFDATVTRCAVGVSFDKESAGGIDRLRVADVTGEGVVVMNKSQPEINRLFVARAATGIYVQFQARPRFQGALLADLADDGVRVSSGSGPSLADVKVVGAGGVGLAVVRKSYPTVGTFHAEGCKLGDRRVDADSKVRTP